MAHKIIETRQYTEIVYYGDDGEEVVSGSCLGEILESLEKWREKGRA